MDLRDYVRDVPDFPRPGILFKDITPLLAHPRAFASALTSWASGSRRASATGRGDRVARLPVRRGDRRRRARAPLQLVRKPGKLPYQTVSVAYELEYGSDRVEIHVGRDPARHGLRRGHDDLIATGGTAAAAAELIEMQARRGRVLRLRHRARVPERTRAAGAAAGRGADQVRRLGSKPGPARRGAARGRPPCPRR